MCGKLVTYLRMCGYDAAYALDRAAGGPAGSSSDDPADAPSDDELLKLARGEGRRIVTRDRQLAARAEDAVLLRARDVPDQLRELAGAGFALELPDEPARCSNCNAGLEPVDPETPTPEYAPDPGETAVWRCVECGQCFWTGSHWDDVAATLAGL